MMGRQRRDQEGVASPYVWGGTTYYDQYPDQERGASFPFSPAGATYFLRRSSVHAITYAPPTEPQAPGSPPPRRGFSYEPTTTRL